MNDRIRLGIAGYGNLGRGVEAAVAQNPDIELVGIFTRRDPASVRPRIAGTPVHRMDDLAAHTGQIDVLVLCGGSKDDLPRQSPALAAQCSLVDSFDTHAHIPEHFAAVDAAAQAASRGASPAEVLAAAAEAAQTGAESTDALQARKGRASYLGERSVGHRDPGAVSTVLVLRAAAEAAGAAGGAAGGTTDSTPGDAAGGDGSDA